MNQAAEIIDIPVMKVCSKCKEHKLLSEFRNRSDRSSGKRSSCKICDDGYKKEYVNKLAKYRPEISQEQKKKKSETHRVWCGKNKDRVKNNFYKWKYGLTLEQVSGMLQSQLGLCANRACGKIISIYGPQKDKAFVDHCHETGKVRGMLCLTCNAALGLLEQKNKMLGLSEYLQKFGSK